MLHDGTHTGAARAQRRVAALRFVHGKAEDEQVAEREEFVRSDGRGLILVEHLEDGSDLVGASSGAQRSH